MVRIGIVGCGKIAQKHLSAYEKIDDVSITLTDVLQTGEDVARDFGVAWNKDPEALIRSKEIDAIDVCVPTHLHASVVLDALNSGRHIFCEKPLARNLEEAEMIVEKARAVGVVAMVGHLYRFHPAFQFVKDVLDQGIIGSPYYALFRLGGRGSHRQWKHQRETGGAGNEMMVHILDLALWYFGDATEVNPLCVKTLLKEREIEGSLVKSDAEDLVLAQMKMGEGVEVLCESDLLTPAYMNYVEVQGDNGSLFASILDYLPTFVYCKEPRGGYDQGHRFLRFPHLDLFEKELRHFVRCVRDDIKPELNSLDEAIKIMALLDRVMGR